MKVFDGKFWNDSKYFKTLIIFFQLASEKYLGIFLCARIGKLFILFLLAEHNDRL